jgi:hypothetical protein
MAAMGRAFDGPDSGTSLNGRRAAMVEVPLREANGSPLSEDEVNDAFARAAAAAPGNAVVWLTHGTKTGLIAPMSPPPAANVVVDACQTRLEPGTVAAYLRQGWPVIITGSKFFGGPAFSGAVLFPRSRLSDGGRQERPRTSRDAVNLGTVLRWTAALAEIDAFEPLAARAANVLAGSAAAIEQAMSSNPALVPIGGQRSGPPSIFSFAVRDRADPSRLMATAELRVLHEDLARRGILLGQPVNLGLFGALRIAIGARDISDAPDDDSLARAFEAIEDVTMPMLTPFGRAR